jgi:hypothetical protein
MLMPGMLLSLAVTAAVSDFALCNLPRLLSSSCRRDFALGSARCGNPKKSRNDQFLFSLISGTMPPSSCRMTAELTACDEDASVTLIVK